MTIGRSPYVGPRAYRTGEQLFGRDREARELLRLLVAERIVLLYSPSGAGKTSLLAAKILGELQGQEFQVLQLARVVGSETGLRNGINPYVSSVLSYWEEGRPEGTAPIDDLHGIDLNGYLTQRSWIRDNPASTLLVLDQFEEVLNQNGRDRAARIDFFRQLGAALQDRDRWAIIAMREEYIAGLDPFLDLLPTRLATRYRLSLLDTEKAKEAIRGPAEREGVEYDPAALERLVTELTVVRSNGQEAYRTDYVEPLHLQVACRRLWDRLPPGTKQILPNVVDTFGTVAEALAGYYRDAVQAVAASTEAIDGHCDESTIRDWFENDLISASGQRDQVQRGAQRTGRLPNVLVERLETHYLVRSELRRGARWYEISHDRLVEAIKTDNQTWYDTYESYEAKATPIVLLRKHVRRYTRLQRLGRDGAEADLLSGNDLREVEEWAEKNRDALSPQDREFIKASQRQRQSVRWRWAAVGCLTVLLVCSGVAASTFYAQKRRIETAQAKLKESYKALETSQSKQLARKLLADSASARWRQDDHELSVLLALQADKATRRAERDPALEANVGDTLRGVLQVRPFTLSPPLDGRRGLGPGRRAFSPDGKAIAVESDGNRVDIVDLGSEPSCRRPTLQMNAAVRRLEYSPGGQHLIATTDQDLEIFRASDFGCTKGSTPAPLGPRRIIPSQAPALGCVVKDDGVILVGEANRISAWTIDDPRAGDVLWSGTSAMIDDRPTAIACAPDGSWVVLGTGTGQMAAFLDPLSGATAPIRFANTFEKWPKTLRTDLAFARDTLTLGVSALVPWQDRTLLGVFKQGPSAIVVLPESPRQAPSVVYLSPTRDSVAELRAAAAFGRPQRSARLTSLFRGTFDPIDRKLIVGSERAIGIWDLAQLFDADDAETRVDAAALPTKTEVYAAYKEIRGPRNGIEALGVLDNGRTIAAADAESSVRLSRLDAPAHVVYAGHKVVLPRSVPPAGVIYGLRFSDDGRRLAVGGSRYLSFVQVDPDSLAMRSTPDDLCVSGSIRAIAGGAGEPWLAWAVQDKNPDARLPGCRAQASGVKNAVWVARDRHPEDPQRLELPDSQGLWSVALSARHHMLAAADYAGAVWLWARDPQTGAPRPDTLRRISASEAVPVRALAFHPSAPLLAFGTEPGAIEIWRLTPSDEGVVEPVRLGTLSHIVRGAVRALAFSPDGKRLVFGDDSGTVSLVQVGAAGSAWNVSAETMAHSAGVTSVAFCDDSSHVKGCDPNVFASAGNDGRVRLWRVAQQPAGTVLEPQLTFEGPESAVLSVTFSPDGGLVAAGDSDGKLHLWPLDPQRLVHGACDVVRRNLSRREWKRYVGDGVPYECTCPDLPPGAQVTAADLAKDSGCGSQLATAEQPSAVAAAPRGIGRP